MCHPEGWPPAQASLAWQKQGHLRAVVRDGKREIKSNEEPSLSMSVFPQTRRQVGGQEARERAGREESRQSLKAR